MAKMKPQTLMVFEYLKEHKDEDLTAADVAQALDLEKKQVDGMFTSFQKKGLGIRVPDEVENEDGSHVKVKYLKLTDEGLAFDPASEEE